MSCGRGRRWLEATDSNRCIRKGRWTSRPSFQAHYLRPALILAAIAYSRQLRAVGPHVAAGPESVDFESLQELPVSGAALGDGLLPPPALPLDWTIVHCNFSEDLVMLGVFTRSLGTIISLRCRSRLLNTDTRPQVTVSDPTSNSISSTSCLRFPLSVVKPIAASASFWL